MWSLPYHAPEPGAKAQRADEPDEPC